MISALVLLLFSAFANSQMACDGINTCVAPCTSCGYNNLLDSTSYTNAQDCLNYCTSPTNSASSYYGFLGGFNFCTCLAANISPYYRNDGSYINSIPHPPTAAPTARPTARPSARPSAMPTAEPTARPSAVPTAEPTATPSATPTATPTAIPSTSPSGMPSTAPSGMPSNTPTSSPSKVPADNSNSHGGFTGTALSVTISLSVICCLLLVLVCFLFRKQFSAIKAYNAVSVIKPNDTVNHAVEMVVVKDDKAYNV